MTNDAERDRLKQLREDLAALRERTEEEFGPVLRGPPTADQDDPAATAPPSADLAAGAWRARAGRPPRSPGSPRRIRVGRTSRPARPPKPPKAPRQGLRRPRTRRPPRMFAVPPPIDVSRRPDYLAAPRWPLWDLPSVALAIVVLVPASLQLVYRLVQAMLDTTVLLGADPTREAYLHAAAGVAGGGLTLAMAIAALAVVKGRAGYLAAAVGVVAAFGIFPHVAYTANAGIVAASLPSLEQMIRPPDWPAQGRLAFVFWLCALALLASLVDLAWRSITALQRGLSS